MSVTNFRYNGEDQGLFWPLPKSRNFEIKQTIRGISLKKFGAARHLFKAHVVKFKAKYYGKYKGNKKSFLSCESNWLDIDVPFARAVRQTSNTPAKKVRKAFLDLGQKQQKRRTEEFLRNVEPGQLEAAARIQFKDAFDSLENGNNTADVKSPKESQ